MPGPTVTPWFRKLHWQVLLGMGVGLALGFFGGAELTPWYSWVGDLFLRALKMVVVPLVVSSIIVGIARIGNPREVGRLGVATLSFYIGTSALSILTGMLLVNLVQPGVGVELAGIDTSQDLATATRSIKDVLYDLVPVNPLGAMAQFGMSREGSAGLIGVIFFCIVLGLATAALKESRRDAILGFFEALFQAMMKITHVIIRLAPLGVASLIAVVIARTGPDVLLPLAGYMGTVIAALALHFFVTIPALIFFLGRRNPYEYMRQVGMALATAFTTASSNATLPIAMEAAQKKGGVSRRVAGFVLPLGATVNMDGTAMYEGIAALFIAQVYGRHLGVDDQFLIFITALLASIGAAGIPHASLVMMTVVFQAVGLPLDAIGMLLGVDRVLTMCRTATNVWSDLGGAAVVSRFQPGSEPPPSAREPPPDLSDP